MPPLKSLHVHEHEESRFCTGSNLLQATMEKRLFSNQNYSQHLLFNLNKLREDESFCDVEIIAGDTVLKAHRAVLSASSAYFEAMFRPELGLSERTQKSVTLHSIAPEILKMLIDFIYAGQMEITQVGLLICF